MRDAHFQDSESLVKIIKKTLPNWKLRIHYRSQAIACSVPGGKESGPTVYSGLGGRERSHLTMEGPTMVGH